MNATIKAPEGFPFPGSILASQPFVLKSVTALLCLLLPASPLIAQRRMSVIVNVEGVRSDRAVQFEPNQVVYEPQFEKGGGAGIGINWFLSGRVSIEAKASALSSRLRLRRTGNDFFAADLGRARIYTVGAVLQWHMLNAGPAIQPYLGVGVGRVLLQDVEKRTLDIGGIEFDNPTGLILNAGTMIGLSKRWSALADVRYTPIETQARARFVGTDAVTEIDVKPLILSLGLAWHF